MDKDHIRRVLESLQRKIPRLCRLTLARAFDVGIAFCAEDCRKATAPMAFGICRTRRLAQFDREREFLEGLKVRALQTYDQNQGGVSNVEEEEGKGVASGARPVQERDKAARDVGSVTDDCSTAGGGQ